MAARLKPRFEEEAQLRQRAGLKQGIEFPVAENSLQQAFRQREDLRIRLLRPPYFELLSGIHVAKVEYRWWAGQG